MDQLFIEKYQDDHEKLWDDFVWNSSRNGTLLHTRRFFRHNILNAANDSSLLFFSRNKLIAVLPAITEYENGKLTFNSHKYSSYGGFVIHANTSFRLIERCIDLLIAYARSRSIEEVVLRQSPRVYHRGLSDEIEYALWKKGFDLKYKECELVLDLTSDFRAEYRRSTKRNIAKARRSGVLVKECADIDRFWEILMANLREKHQVEPVHTSRQIQSLRELAGAESIKLFGSYLGQQMIGGILLFVSNSEVVHAQYMASDSNFQSYRPINALIDFVAGWASGKGFRYFSLGTANKTGGLEINDGLYRFKQGFGAKGTSRDTLHYNFSEQKDKASL